jgi:hypothetical protein
MWDANAGPDVAGEPLLDVMEESHVDFHLSTDADGENSGFHLL